MEVTEENRERIDAVIEQFIAERSALGKCSRVPAEASGEISGDRTMRDELIERLRKAAAPVDGPDRPGRHPAMPDVPLIWFINRYGI